MLYDNETWPVKIDDTCRPQRTGMQMTRWLCNINLSESRPSEEMPDRLVMQNISVVMRLMRRKWFGHTERMETENWVNKCRSLVIDCATGRRRQHKTWNKVVQNDLQILHLEKALAQDRVGWRDAIKKTPSYPC